MAHLSSRARWSLLSEETEDGEEVDELVTKRQALIKCNRLLLLIIAALLLISLILFGAALLFYAKVGTDYSEGIPVNAETAGQAAVFLFEWHWSDIAQECEQFLGPKGYKAVVISPPNEHIPGETWWTRYQPVSYKLTSRSGDEAAFSAMVQRCAAVGVGIYADAVVNHCASGEGVGVAGTHFFQRKFEMYRPENFHHDATNTSHNCKVSDWDDKKNVQHCDLSGLPDLRTGSREVQNMLSSYLQKLLEYGVQGFRIDAAKHINATELRVIMEQGSRNHTPFIFQEVFTVTPEAVTAPEYFPIGHVTEFLYIRAIESNFIPEGKLKYLASLGETWGLMDRRKALIFIDNHDTQRGFSKLTHKVGSLYTLANVFMLAWPYGYPVVMSSYSFLDAEQGPPTTPVHGPAGLACGPGQAWVCEHRRPAIANMVAWRRTAGTADVANFAASPDGNGIAFCRGSACVALNRASSTLEMSLQFSLPPGDYYDVLCADDFTTCAKVTVGADGQTRLQVPPVGAVAFHAAARAPTGVSV